MDYTKSFVIDMDGDESNKRRSGTFKVKTMLTRRDRFVADEWRRRIIGNFNAEGALITLQEEAFVIGQLQVRVIEAPDWWTEAGNGIDLEDGNVIAKVYEEAIKAEQERKGTLVSSAKQVAENIKKKDAKEKNA